MARFGIWCAVFMLVLFSAPAVEAAPSEEPAQDTTRTPEFMTWLGKLREEARQKGISDETLDRVLPDITPRRRIVKRDRNQPERVQTYGDYLGKRVSPWRIRKGRDRFKADEQSLADASAAYGVQARFIASIWGLETNYGTVPLTISVFDAVATLAFDPRRAKRFRGELFAALKIVDQGLAPLEVMKGSWAGAMGQPQFMPVNYLRYAVDQDGDGIKDIWTSNADIHGSIAHYLSRFQWRDDQTWGRPVHLPTSDEESLQGNASEGLKAPGTCGPYKSIGIWRDLQDWQALGVRRLDGSDLPARTGLPTALILGDKGDGRGYLVYQNFCAIMRYNPSFKYALAVGLLSDEIARNDREPASR